MFSYKQIIKLSSMFIEMDDPYLTPCSLYDNINLADDLPWNYTLLNFPPSEFLIATGSNNNVSNISSSYISSTATSAINAVEQIDLAVTYDDRPISPRSLIRHHDCMWSGRCTTHPDKFQCNYMKQHKQHQTELRKLSIIDTTFMNAKNGNIGCCGSAEIERNVQRQHQHHQSTIGKKTEPAESIPAGRSLLINSRLNQTKASTVTTVLKLPTVSTNDFLKERQFIARPDTPLSLDDDSPIFKHTIDLAACTMGSNKISLSNDDSNNNDGPTEIINMLKEHLEDTSVDDNSCNSIRNKLNAFLPNGSNTDSLTDLMKDIKSLSDFEGIDDDDDDDEEDELIDEDDEDEYDSNNSSSQCSNKNIINNSADEMDSDVETTSIAVFNRKHNINNNSNFLSNKSSQLLTATTTRSTLNDMQQTMHSDHSYTRCKSRVNVVGLGVQTPSDSEEEIDVVSIGEKTLPTNPTDRDRRALQTTVAHKISARTVKTTAGIRTIQPRRQYYESSTTGESEGSCSVTPTKSTNSKYNNTVSSDGTVVTIQYKSRKRPNANRDERTTTAQSTTYSSSSTNAKRQKGKKQRTTTSARRRNSDIDETDTIEKRNQHNDMERQRRIGLKNLFEELKKQLPNLKDKERAPKVSILREATQLCRKFNREEEEKASLKKRQSKLYHRVSVLRTSLAAQRNKYVD